MSKNKTFARVALIGMATILAASSLTPAMAGSTPTTAITTKLDANQVYLGEARVYSINYRKISGTAANLSVPTVDIACINTVTGDIIRTLKSSVPVTAGKWSTYIELYYMDGYLCQLRALPTGTSPSGDTAAAKINSVKSFTGPVIRTGQLYWYYKTIGTPTSMWSYDAGLYWSASKAKLQLWGVEDGGFYSWQPRTDEGTEGRNIVNGLFSTYRPSMTGPTGNSEANLIVDGAQAFHPYYMDYNDFNMANPDANNARYNISIDPKTGQISYSETAPLFKCEKPESGRVYSYLSDCPDDLTVKVGVSWKHEVEINTDGTVALTTDTFTSEDKKKHTVKLDIYSSFSGIDGVRYGKTGAFGSISSDAKTKLAGLGAKYRTADPTSMSNPVVQIVYTTAPVTTWVSYTTFYSRYNISVAAGKSSSVKAGATLITDDTKAAAQITAAGK